MKAAVFLCALLSWPLCASGGDVFLCFSPSEIVVKRVRELSKRPGYPHKIHAFVTPRDPLICAVTVSSQIVETRADKIFFFGYAGSIAEGIGQGSIVEIASVTAAKTIEEAGSIKLDYGDSKRVLPLSSVGLVSAYASINLPNAKAATVPFFIQSEEIRSSIRRGSDAEVVDMVLYPIALAARSHRASLTAVCLITDRADANAGSDFRMMVGSKSDELALAAAEVVLRAKPRADSPALFPNLSRLIRPE